MYKGPDPAAKMEIPANIVYRLPDAGGESGSVAEATAGLDVGGTEGVSASDDLLPGGMDPRIEGVLRLIMQLAGGNLSARGEVSSGADDLDAVTEGLNMLAEELAHSTVSVEVFELKARELEKRVQELREAQGQLRELADLDPLTQLPNRRVFDDRLDMTLRRCKRENGRAAVLYEDIDRFKPVNDRYGHAAGDQVLTEIARRLQRCMRDTDSVSRLGGDEFALLLDPGPSTRETTEIVARILAAIRVPIEVDGASIETGASVGIAFFPDDAEGAVELVQTADAAMYRSKRGPESAVFASDRPRSE